MLVSRVIDTTFINSYLVLSKINSAMEQQLSRVHHVISWFILMSSFHPTSYVGKIIMSLVLLKTILSPKFFTNN